MKAKVSEYAWQKTFSPKAPGKYWPKPMVMKSADRLLASLRVLVCRPEPRARLLCDELNRLGADTRALPMIEVQPLPETTETQAIIQDFDQFSHIITVSPLAADSLLDRLDRWWPQLPSGQSWYAVGPGTAKRLAQAGIRCTIAEQGHDSESLLQLAELNHFESIDRVLICGGEGGRRLLAETLAERGARVSRLSLYQRLCPTYSQARLDVDLVQFAPHAIVALSGETLNNLLGLGQNADSRLRHRVIIVPTQRVAEQARLAGFERPVVARTLDTAGLAEALAQIPERALDQDPGTGIRPSQSSI